MGGVCHTLSVEEFVRPRDDEAVIVAEEREPRSIQIKSM